MPLNQRVERFQQRRMLPSQFVQIFQGSRFLVLRTTIRPLQMGMFLQQSAVGTALHIMSLYQILKIRRNGRMRRLQGSGDRMGDLRPALYPPGPDGEEDGEGMPKRSAPLL